MPARFGILQSMSRKCSCFGNAVIECFFGTLKVKYFYLAPIEGIEALEAGRRDCIDYCNNERVDLGLRDLSPVKKGRQASPDRRDSYRSTSGGQS